MLDNIKSLLQFEIKFIFDMVVSLLGLVVVTEVLLGPLFRNETYISFVLNSLNSQEGFIAILIVVFLYAWATEEN
jgi:hypothetical protein